MDRTQQLDLAVVEMARVESGRRLHRDQAQQLQQMVLDHVAQRAGVVVVAGAALQRDGLVPDDLDPLDVLGVSKRLKDAVGEPQPEDVSDGLQAEEVVSPQDHVLPEAPVQQPDEGPRLSKAAPEQLLDHHPAAGRESHRSECLDRWRERGRGEREVGDERALGLVDRAGEDSCVTDISPEIAGQGRDGFPCRRVDGGRVAFQPRVDVAAEGSGVQSSRATPTTVGNSGRRPAS
jgi:hypothetical protein